MASGDTKIRFTVEGINQLHTEFQKILTDSQSLTKEWESQGTSIVNSLREQIELLKKRNSIAGVPSASGTTSSYTTGSTSSMADVEKALEDFATDGVRISTSSLRELAEILSGKGGTVEEGSRPGGGRIEDKGKPESEDDGSSALFKTISSFALANTIRMAQTRDPMLGMADVGSNLGSALMMSGNPYAMMGGVVLQGITGLARIPYEALKEILPVGEDAARLLGGSWKGQIESAKGYEQYGFGASDVLQRKVALARAMGRQELGTNVEDALLWEQTTSLSASDIASFARSARGDVSFNVGDNLSLLVADLRRSGVRNEKISTQMSEYLGQIVNLNQLQLDQMGRSDSNITSGIYSAIASVLPETAENNPAFIGRMAQGLMRGLSNPTTEQSRALRYSSIAQANPNVSWFEMKMMAEDPFGLFEGLSDTERNQRQSAAQRYLSMQQKAGGDWQGFAQILHDEYGMSYNVAGKMAQDFNFDEFMKTIKAERDKQKETEELQKRLPETVTSISQMLAEWNNTKLFGIDKIEGFARNIYEFLSGETAGVSELTTDVLRSRDNVSRDLKENGGFSHFMNWLVTNAMQQTTQGGAL